MNSLTDTRVFNNARRIVEGWYWAMPSAELKRGRAKALSFLGREMALYRGHDGRVRALDAYCPHMGAHLAEGKVQDNDIRCLFHHWKYNSEGRCVEIPCQRDSSFVPKIPVWPVEEKYGLIWIWAGGEPRAGVPAVPELENEEVETRLANRFTKRCHPNVMMINAIDAQHFNSVHNLPVDLRLEPTVVSDNCIMFRNTTKVQPESLFTRFVSRFYKDALRYALCYWFGSTGAVTIGPDFLRFHIIFALRPTEDGRSEGQTILVTRKRKGIAGKAFSRALLLLTRLVGAYFAKGDTVIFETIRFNFRTPIKADSSIIRFIEHVEKQRTRAWGLESEDDESNIKNPESYSRKISVSR